LAWAQIVAPQLLDQLLVAVDDADAALHVGFRREPFPPLTGVLKRRAVRRPSSALPWVHLPSIAWEPALSAPVSLIFLIDQGASTGKRVTGTVAQHPYRYDFFHAFLVWCLPHGYPFIDKHPCRYYTTVKRTTRRLQ
jgi:hypothetical protein